MIWWKTFLTWWLVKKIKSINFCFEKVGPLHRPSWKLLAITNCNVQISFHFQNCVPYSEAVFATESLLSAGNQCSLPKWCCLQRIRVHCQNCIVCNEVVFVVKIVLCAMNQSSLPKLCCLQRISVWCWNYIVYSESLFAAKIVLSVAN